MARPLEGGCLCGGVRFRVSAAPLRSGYCHCRMCQKNSGAPVVAWAEIPAAGFAFVKGAPSVYRSSPKGERLFCPDCGSYMVFREPGSAKTISINTASLDDPAAIPPDHHIWISSRIGWFETTDDLPRHAKGAPG